MKIATSELEHLREEVKNCHRIIKDLQKKRDFVGLTDDERERMVDLVIADKKTKDQIGDLQRMVEAKLKEKNNA